MMSLFEILSNLPDDREQGKIKHEQAEVYACVLLGMLAGKTTLRRIISWCERNLTWMRKYMPLKKGIASLSTFSRILAATDGDILALELVNWVGGILDTRGIHIAIDGKGLRAAASKMRDERTPYILNAIDVATKVVICQIAISEKTNEISTIPELLDMIEISGSTVTIDAIGSTVKIMEKIHDKGADFVLQVKNNCPELLKDIFDLFNDIEKEEEDDPKKFKDEFKDKYSRTSKKEKNRDRHEYRDMKVYSDPQGIEGIKEERPYIKSVGLSEQVRIKIVKDREGNDITPGYDDFLKNGSRRQPKTDDSNDDDSIQRYGVISSMNIKAKAMARFKREHWIIENSLHYELDESFGEDKCRVVKGKFVMGALRRTAYNIIRFLQIGRKLVRDSMILALDEIADKLELAIEYIFKPVKSMY